MTSDPPPSISSQDTSPNLRDLQLEPTAIVKARPTIIHPQLRDLILPLERGRVLYPRGNSIEDLRFFPRLEEDEEEEGMKSSVVGPHLGSGRDIAYRLDSRVECYYEYIGQIEFHT
jgi:hypothetical protein